MERTGVLLTAFGGPGDLDEIAPFMSSLMGREPSEGALTDARRRYLTIGGASPLPGMAERIAVQLERSLSGLAPATEDEDEGPSFLGHVKKLERAGAEAVKVPVAVGMLHSEPTIARAVAALADAGVRRIVSLSLSPFEAAATTGAYRAAVEAVVSAHEGLSVVDAADYRRSDAFLSVLAEELHVAMNDELIRPTKPLVVFTAHSLPVEDVEADPAYVDQLRETAAAVADRSDLGAPDGFEALPDVAAFGGHGATPWLLAFQSKGRRGGDWIGPDLDDVIDAAAAEGFGSVVVSPIGFAVDHMETLYDLDVCAADRSLSAGLEFVRAVAPNDEARMIEALAEAVKRVL